MTTRSNTRLCPLHPAALLIVALVACGEAQPTTEGEVHHGLFNTPWGVMEVPYVVRDGKAVVGGDMTLPLPDSNPFGATSSGLRTAGFGLPAGPTSWPEGDVPYRIGGGLAATDPRILDAIAKWEQKTKVRFRLKTNSDTQFVSFVSDASKCSSDVGRGAGATVVRLAAACNYDSVVHEIGHALGLWHEHQRPDRDLYVAVDFALIANSELLPNYLTLEDSGLSINGEDGPESYGAYDLASVMHYSSFETTIGGQWVLTALDPVTNLPGVEIVDVGDEISAGDVLAAHRANGLTANLDMNGDGFSDLVVGVPGEHMASINDAGALQIIRGRSTGIGTFDQFAHRDTVGVSGVAEANDRFGTTLAFGDFNADGYTDAVVGVPNDDPTGITNAGSIQVFYGGNSFPGTNRIFRHSGNWNAYDGYGYSMTTGDFNGDGYDDLAVGMPYADAIHVDQGIVGVRYGSATGLSDVGAQEWTQDSTDVNSNGRPYERFGFSLAAGDFNRDGFDELAIGTPNERVGGHDGAGAVIVLRGTIDGLTGQGSQLWTADNIGVSGFDAANGDQFGWALTTGDFARTKFDALAIGIPHRTVNGRTYAGAVAVVYGDLSGSGLSNNFVQVVGQSAPCANSVCIDVSNTAETYDRFGRSLAAGDFDGDFADDLVVGVPFESFTGASYAGAANVIYGAAATGLRASGSRTLLLDQFGVPVGANDNFGYSLRVADYNGDTYSDLAISAPREDVSGANDAGAVGVYFGSSGGLQTSGGDLVTQDRGGILDTAEAYDRFGHGL